MSLRDLFHKPAITPIGGVNFLVYKLAFDQFDDGLEFGKWLEALDEKGDLASQAAALKSGEPMRSVVTRLVAGSLRLAPGEGQDALAAPGGMLQPADVELMPAAMLADSVAVLLEVNADFFFQTLPTMLGRINRIKSTGLELLNNLSPQGTPPSASAA